MSPSFKKTQREDGMQSLGDRHNRTALIAPDHPIVGRLGLTLSPTYSLAGAVEIEG